MHLLFLIPISVNDPDGLIIADVLSLVEKSHCRLIAAGMRARRPPVAFTHCNFPWLTPRRLAAHRLISRRATCQSVVHAYSRLAASGKSQSDPVMIAPAEHERSPALSADCSPRTASTPHVGVWRARAANRFSPLLFVSLLLSAGVDRETTEAQAEPKSRHHGAARTRQKWSSTGRLPVGSGGRRFFARQC
jgi:hypothetical protein